jgi:hypothetical protein
LSVIATTHSLFIATDRLQHVTTLYDQNMIFSQEYLLADIAAFNESAYIVGLRNYPPGAFPGPFVDGLDVFPLHSGQVPVGFMARSEKGDPPSVGRALRELSL